MLNFIRKKKVNSALSKAQRDKKFLNYDSIKNILILFNITDWADIERVVEALRRDGKNVQLWTVRSKETANAIVPNEIRVINAAKEVSWSQSLLKNVLDEFEKVNYETLLDLSAKNDNILEYLLAVNTSNFCIGIRETETKVYDFVMIKKEEDDIFTTFEQMKIYLGHNIQ